MPEEQKYNKKTGTHSNIKTSGVVADAKFAIARATGQASKNAERVQGRKGERMQIESDDEDDDNVSTTATQGHGS